MGIQDTNIGYEDWRSNQLCPALEEIPTRIVESGDTQISYRRSEITRSSNPTLVFLHGIGSTSASWIKQFQTLSASYNMIAWDMPGYKLSSPIGLSHPQPVDYANVLRTFLAALDVHKPILIGHSLGALQALAYAVNFPGDIEGLILANPALGYAHLPAEEQDGIVDRRLNMLRDLGASDLAKERAPRLLSKEANDEDLKLVRYNMSGLNSVGYEGACRMLVSGNAFSDAENYPNPVSIITGEEDIVTPPSGAKILSGKFPISNLTILPGAGHASYIESPNEFDAAVSSYVKSCSVKREAS